MTIESVGGIRLIRKLGEGERAEVHLVRLRDGSGGTAALKVYRAHVDPLSVSAEIEALARAEGPHILSLQDLTSTENGIPALLLDRLGRGSLTGLLRDRSHLKAGEAITILAPLAQAVARAHRSGAVHAGIRPDAVLFDAAGAPVLACFGRAFPIGRELPPARLSAEPGVALDVASFAALARAVLAHVDDPGMRALSDFAQPGPALESHEWLERFGDRLFDAGDACAVEFPADSGSTSRVMAPALPSRAPTVTFSSVLPPTGVDSASTIVNGQGATAATARSRDVGAAVSTSADWVSDRIPEVAREALARAVAALRTVRTRWWMALAMVGILVVGALVLIPSRQVAQGPLPAPTWSATPEGMPGAGPDATSADAPVDALAALLGSRERCIAQLSVLCLDAVDQSGSAALAADQALVRSLQSGAEAATPWAIDKSQLAEVERLGDSALVAIADPAETEPASILLMKGEAGWRIRDYLAR